MNRTLKLSVLGLALLGLAGTAWAVTPATPLDENQPVKPVVHERMDAAKAPGDLVDFDAALAAGADYLRKGQADVTEDNAGNGNPDDDLEDGGWDWSLTDPDFDHSASASPTNIYGATAQGVLRAYLATGDAALATVMDDAANYMITDANVRSAGDMIFLMRYDDLGYVVGTTYADAARAKYDARIASQGSAQAFAEYIRDVRGVTQGYPNGIIAWDVGAFAVVAAMLDDRYPGNGYDADADDIAEVIWQDSFNDNPGLFDVVDDQGYDPTYTDKNFWWYNLGITGLIDAFAAADVHTGEIPGLIGILKDGQLSNGGFSDAYGAEPGDEDWQSTAYAVLTLASYDQATYQREIDKAAYWIGATQQAASGGWVYGSGNHYPEIGGENTAALSYGMGPTDAFVDDDWASQADVDVYNDANGTDYVWGYDAFDNVQDGIDAVVGSTVNVLPGTYAGTLVLNTSVNLHGPQQGVDARGRVASEAVLTSSSGAVLDVNTAGVVVDGFTVTGSGSAGKLVDCTDAGQDFQLKNTIVGGVGSSIAYFGVTSANVLIEQNDIDATGMTGYACYFDGNDAFDDMIIRDNDFAGGEIFAGDKNYSSTNLLMTGNEFDGTNINLSSQFENSTISDNTFLNNGYTNGQVGLRNSTISGNTFQAAGPSPGAGYPSYALMLWGDQYSLTPSENVDVTGNTFYCNAFSAPDELSHGLRILSGIDATTIAIHDNNFLDQGAQSGAFGLVNQGSGAADASCNWWTDAGGPDTPGNPNPAGAGISGDAVYWPWLDGVAPGGACVVYGSDNVAANPTGEISPCNPCLKVPIDITRTDTSNLRGVSITFELSSELELCGDDIEIATGAGSLYDGYTNTQLLVIDNGGGSYTADVTLLGTPCGPTTDGTVITVDVTDTGVVGDATGTITVTGVTVRDCANAPLPGIPGPPADVTINNGAPGVVTDLAAAQKKTGNDSDGTTIIDLTWTDPVDPDLTTIEIYRKGYGDYPEYDDGTGAVPTPPATPGGGGWSWVASVAAGDEAYADEPPTRDFWYYVAYAVDNCNLNVSAVSGMTDGTLNYHLGDVADGVNAPESGDNLVFTDDISHLGTNYGIALAHGDAVNYLDVGPTTDYGVDALPTTDNMVQFEDLMMFAINYNQVSKDLTRPVPASHNAISLNWEPAAAGELLSVELRMQGDGGVQGLSVPLTWDASVVEPVGVSGGDLLTANGGMSLVVSPEPGVVDAALFGVRDLGICGEGVLATVSFRVLGSGDPGLGLADVTARDAENRQVQVESAVSDTPPGPAPQVSELRENVPNPFNPLTEIKFATARDGRVRLSVYTLRGRLVRTLVDGDLPSGPHAVTWDGTDGTGRRAASGNYVLRMEAPDRVQSRHITLLK